MYYFCFSALPFLPRATPLGASAPPRSAPLGRAGGRPRAERIGAVGANMATVPVYCICRLPYDVTRFMIECDACKDWFHGR